MVEEADEIVHEPKKQDVIDLSTMSFATMEVQQGTVVISGDGVGDGDGEGDDGIDDLIVTDDFNFNREF